MLLLSYDASLLSLIAEKPSRPCERMYLRRRKCEVVYNSDGESWKALYQQLSQASQVNNLPGSGSRTISCDKQNFLPTEFEKYVDMMQDIRDHEIQRILLESKAARHRHSNETS